VPRHASTWCGADGSAATDMSDTETPRPFRVLPAVGPDNEHFWLGGADGELRFLRCTACRYWIHPPTPVCPNCLSTELAVEAASGRGVVHTFTVNWQPWIPTFDPPYVIAVIELPEQDGLRLTTNIVGCEHDDVSIGMAVEVTFLEYDGVWLPLFQPVAEVAS
jgi:uncharacterized protein